MLARAAGEAGRATGERVVLLRSPCHRRRSHRRRRPLLFAPAHINPTISPAPGASLLRALACPATGGVLSTGLVGTRAASSAADSSDRPLSGDPGTGRLPVELVACAGLLVHSQLKLHCRRTAHSVPFIHRTCTLRSTLRSCAAGAAAAALLHH